MYQEMLWSGVCCQTDVFVICDTSHPYALTTLHSLMNTVYTPYLPTLIHSHIFNIFPTYW